MQENAQSKGGGEEKHHFLPNFQMALTGPSPAEIQKTEEPADTNCVIFKKGCVCGGGKLTTEASHLLMSNKTGTGAQDQLVAHF